ncbi:MAG: AI-2E family transporter, partial [Armatimonadetes bacterium]|nr:AI-2E family transporter [Armatimonadota bacterium]NIM24736.1 AI-2E family transporter [Armatimonadota bacterium]NIM68616.1 AI-2E family transporter [Armatimonadota bacterium]NIM77133.1 AI-2E family transporter [Armatimonadota bacterium]NIN06810.1 AI-2E family transporter [Armatimonadota bacterium]
GVVAYLLNPIIDKLEAKRWPRTYAILLLLLGVLAIGLIIGFLLIPRLWGELSGLIQDYGPLAEKAEASYQQWLARLQTAFPWLRLEGELGGKLNERLAALLPRLLGKVPSLLGKLLQSIAGFITLMVVTLILAYWLLKDYHPLGRRLLAFIPERHNSSVVSLSSQINQIISAYLLGLLLLCGIAAVTTIIILLIFGVDYGYLLGLVVGVGYAIPYFGVPIATLITVIVAALTGQPWPNLLGIVAALLGLNFVLDYLVSPRVIGERVGLHPMTVIFALLAAGELFGLIGIIIALPLAAAIRACLVTFFPDFFSPQPAPATEPEVPAETDKASAGETKGQKTESK